MSDLDCGDNSCMFATQRKGMRTNGGCRCFEQAGFSRSALQSAREILPELLRLRAEVEHLKAHYAELVEAARGCTKALTDKDLDESFDSLRAALAKLEERG